MTPIYLTSVICRLLFTKVLISTACTLTLIQQVTGCASPELGAHVLLKFLNRSGYELGSAVVSLTHLLHTSTEEIHATLYSNVSICGIFV